MTTVGAPSPTQWMCSLKLAKAGISTFHSRARFVGATTIAVDDERLDGLRPETPAHRSASAHPVRSGSAG